MSNKLTDKATSTTTPTNWFANIGGAVRQFTAAAFNSLIGSLLGPQTNAATSKETPADADKLPLSDSAASNATKHVTWANVKAALQSVLTPAAHSADLITSGTLDVARLPVLYSGVQVVSSGGIADLDGGQQTTITQGAVVTTTDGRRWVYSGSGSKTSEASYIELGDVSPTWDVVAGKPSTFTPSTHASAHASGGGDAIKLDDLAAPDDTTDLDATTSAHGLMSKADKTKLDGVEASADVTDAGNVGAAIHGATEKTTPVNADKIAIIDSEASNVLKWVSKSNLAAVIGGGADWGDIGGTLADQTDLQAALDALLPKSGGTMTGSLIIDAPEAFTDPLIEAGIDGAVLFRSKHDLTRIAVIGAGSDVLELASIYGSATIKVAGGGTVFFGAAQIGYSADGGIRAIDPMNSAYYTGLIGNSGGNYLVTNSAILSMGVVHATTPTNQTIKGHDVTTGTGAALTLEGGGGSVARGAVMLHGGNRAAYDAAPSATVIRDILISHGLMAAS